MLVRSTKPTFFPSGTTKEVNSKNLSMAPVDIIIKDDKEVGIVEPSKNTILDDIKDQVKNVEKAVATRDSRYMLRVTRSLLSIRKNLSEDVLTKIIVYLYPNGKENFCTFVGADDMEVDQTLKSVNIPKLKSVTVLPETNIYCHLLVLLYLIDSKEYQKAAKCASNMMTKIVAQNRRTLDLLAAKCYFYYARVYELLGKASEIRKFLLARYRTCTLRNDFEGVAVLTNLILRNFILYKLYTQADKFVSKSVFPDQASNNEWARYYYYLGKIKAIHLEYTLAQKNLTQAARKGPQILAIGFKQSINKLSIVVQLLLGEIPERNVFKEPVLQKSLLPYFQLTQAVRLGDLEKFTLALSAHKARFIKDDTYTHIIRLHHNVIKTGIRKINTSYSRISLADIAGKLRLGPVSDAEFIVAKAIRDGAIEAVIDYDEGFVKSKDKLDVYSSTEPQEAFHKRIVFCLDVHDRSVKSLRFPPKHYNDDMETNEGRREKEHLDLEIAKQLAESDEEDFF